MEEKVEMTQKYPCLQFGTPQKMSQLGFIGYNSPIDFWAFWGPSWDLLKDQICCVNCYVMIVVADIARAWWDATCLHISTGFSGQSERFAGEARGRSEAGKPVAHRSTELMRFSGQLGTGAIEVDSVPPQANFS